MERKPKANAKGAATKQKKEPVVKEKKETVKEKKETVKQKKEPVVKEKKKPAVKQKKEPVVKQKKEPVVKEKKEPVVKEKKETVVKQKKGPVVKEKKEPVLKEKKETVVKQKKEPAVKLKKGPVVKLPCRLPTPDPSSSSDDDDGEDWEEVQSAQLDDNNHIDPSDQPGPSIPAEGLVITVKQAGAAFKKGRKRLDPNEKLRQNLNRKMRSRQIMLHKASLVCCLSRGMQLNDILNNEDIQALALSIMANTVCANRPKRINLPYLNKLLTWARCTFFCTANDDHTKVIFPEGPPLPKGSFYFDDNESLDHLKSAIEKQLTDRTARLYTNRLHKVLTMIIVCRSLGIDTRLVCSLQPAPIKPHIDDLLKKPKSESDTESEDEQDEQDKTDKKKKAAAALAKKSKTSAKTATHNKTIKSNGVKGKKIINSSDDDEVIQFIISQEGVPKKQIGWTPPKFGNNFWLEVFLHEEERWVSVEMQSGRILGDSELEAEATKPMLYVLAFDNENKVKDITRKYASKWLTQTVKQRVDSEWWEDSLAPFKVSPTTKDKEEDDFLDQMIMSKSSPLPQNVMEFKNHPVYALRRFLLKYEAIYPPDAPTLGHVKSEPVYSRDCVKTLHTRSKWKQLAKVVRLGEEPYKLVKSVSKYNKALRQAVPNEQMTELFGEWQVEDFIPEIAKDGKVPRNEYGNVELFQPKMLPTGTVHLLLPGLGRVAKKLGIDCSPAITGFETGYGGGHPIFEGFVVCEEYKELMVDAWVVDQAEQAEKAKETQRNRARKNWLKLYRGVRIMKRLNQRYSVDISRNLSIPGASTSSQISGTPGNVSNRKRPAVSPIAVSKKSKKMK